MGNDIEIPTETKIITDSMNPLSPDSTLLSPKLFTKTSHIHAKSANDIFSQNNDDEEKWVPSPRESIVGQKNAFKISKVMKRKYLLSDNKQFIEYLNDAINNGLNDKSGDTRNTALKILEEVLSIDAFALSKFNKWKERKNKSKGKGNK